jgi:response regulator of citrate/malate metabolism
MILGIDDDPLANLILRRTLAKYGLASEMATNMKDAIQKIVIAKKIDLIFLDLYLLSGTNGLDFLDFRRKTPELREIPVVIISGADDLGIMTEVFKYGANGFIIKPINEQILKNSLIKFGLIPS